MSIAVARIHETVRDYEVAAISEAGIVAGLEDHPKSVADGDLLSTDVPILIEPGINIILREFGHVSMYLSTIAASSRDSNVAGIVFTRGVLKEVKFNEFLVSGGLLVLGFINIEELKEHRDIFERSDLTDGQAGTWK